MANYLTTKQLQEILQVDRTTIYRMADSGRVPAVKVGNQWRFPQDEIDTWLQSQNGGTNGNERAAAPASRPALRKVLPLECVQLIQDTFADVLGVMILITDLEGRVGDTAQQSLRPLHRGRDIAGGTQALHATVGRPGR